MKCGHISVAEICEGDVLEGARQGILQSELVPHLWIESSCPGIGVYLFDKDAIGVM